MMFVVVYQRAWSEGELVTSGLMLPSVRRNRNRFNDRSYDSSDNNINVDVSHKFM